MAFFSIGLKSSQRSWIGTQIMTQMWLGLDVYIKVLVLPVYDTNATHNLLKYKSIGSKDN